MNRCALRAQSHREEEQKPEQEAGIRAAHRANSGEGGKMRQALRSPCSGEAEGAAGRGVGPWVEASGLGGHEAACILPSEPGPAQPHGLLSGSMRKAGLSGTQKSLFP